MSRSARPAILLVFANPRRDLALNRETSGIRAALRSRRDLELIVLEHPALAEIEDTFQDRRNQIVAFHYSGHANGFQQMLESEHGTEQRIRSKGFAEFLASQESLRFVFLNGCSTRGQVDDFFAAGVPCVLATTTDVDDELATSFSLRFYTGLSSGANLQIAYEESVASIKAQATNLPDLASPIARGIRVGVRNEAPENLFPWQIHAQGEQALAWSLDQEVGRRRPQRKQEDDVSQVQLQRLLNFVEEQWVHGMLERNSPAGLLTVGKVARPDMINDPFEGIVEYASQDQEAVGPDETILGIYHRVQKRLLLLGQPGSGKTTTLLQLVKELIHQAHRDPALPVPVVLSLSRWTDETQSFRDWLQSQLSELYSVPRKLSGAWLENHELVLLLDGVDEVVAERRSDCIRSLNQYLDETGVPGIVVSSRIDEYSELPERLRVAGALHLQPLNDLQISEFINAGGTRFAPLKAILQQNESLRALAQSPLLLNIMSQVYDDQYVAQTSNTQATEGAQTTDLFNRFIDRMFLRRGRGSPPFDRSVTEAGLVWLARQMHISGTSLFLLEWLQPSWLTRGQMVIYCFLVSLAPALFFGATLGFFWWCTAQISSDTRAAVDHGLWWWPTPLCFAWFLLACGIDQFLPNFAARGDWNRWKNLIQGVVKAAIYFAIWMLILLVPLSIATVATQAQWMALVLSGAVASLIMAASGWQHRTMTDIHPAEAITFSWKRAGYAAPLGLAAGFLLWLLFRAVWSEEPNIRIRFFNSENSHGFVYVLICMSVIGALTGAILGGVGRASLLVRKRPNQGIVNSRHNAIVVGVVSGAVMTVTVLCLMLLQDLHGTERNVADIVVFSMGIGWSVVACSATLFGGFDVLKHHVLLGILTACRQLPSPLNKFLGYACELNILKPVGGGYLFLHRLLLDHFAARIPQASPDEKRSQP